MLLFSLGGNEPLARNLAQHLQAEWGEWETRHFPDGETYVRVLSEVRGKSVVLVCPLDNPDPKLLPLYFLAQTLRELGAKQVLLVAPYLAYMRQDTRFLPGEGITSDYFARLLSGFADGLVTVDPHLHRRSSLSEIYTIPAVTVHAADLVAHWIGQHVRQPLLVGPDSESRQWVAEVAGKAGCPFIVLEKHRHGDRQVEVSVPNVSEYRQHTPVLVDDIISTARTMIETVGHLKRAGMQPPVCVGVHGIFAGDAYQQLQAAGAGAVVSCNTIAHPSNAIDVSALLAEAVREMCAEKKP